MRSLLDVLLMRLDRLPRPNAMHDSLVHPAYASFRNLLDANIATCVDVVTCAARIGYSVRTLDRACLSAVGSRAKQVLDSRRVLEAQRLLAYSKGSIALLAQELGFSEATNFTKWFKRMTGDTPSAFRHSVQ